MKDENNILEDHTIKIGTETNENNDMNQLTDELWNIEDMPIIFSIPENEPSLNEEILCSNNININLPEEPPPSGGDLLTTEANMPNESEEMNNKSIGDFLVWLESPVRKGKRDVERIPFVLTSEKWKKIQSSKREKKGKEEQEKEGRKRKRAEKQEENKLKKLNIDGQKGKKSWVKENKSYQPFHKGKLQKEKSK